jgi:hypothetical protein
MTSGKPLTSIERAYIAVTGGRLSHAVIAWHLTMISHIPRKRKGVKDYFRRQRKQPAAP